LTFIFAQEYNLSMGRGGMESWGGMYEPASGHFAIADDPVRRGGPEAGPNRGNRIPESAAKTSASEAARTQNPMEAFLEGHGRGTPRFKAAADHVALAEVRDLLKLAMRPSDILERNARLQPILETIRVRKTEADGRAYEEAAELFISEVQDVYYRNHDVYYNNSDPKVASVVRAERAIRDMKSHFKALESKL
jgi:hypothetical protein